MKNLLLKVLLILGALGFSSASASGLDVKVGDNIIYSVSGDKVIVTVIDVKDEGALFTAKVEVEDVKYILIFEKMPDDIYSVVMMGDGRYMTTSYYKKDGDFFKDYSIKTKKIYQLSKKSYFTKL